MYIELWHGTNQDFDSFDPEALGLNTSNEASRQAFFFSAGPRVAWDYAEYASRNLVRNQIAHDKAVAALIDQANEAESRRDFRLYERLIMQAEEMESVAMNDLTSNATLLCCQVRIDNPAEVDGAGRLLDLPALIREAMAAGHDALIIRDYCDTPSGAGGVDDHYAIFSKDAIEILARHMSLEEVAEAMEPA